MRVLGGSWSSVNYWRLPLGSAAYALGMLFWRSRQLVFMDLICIYQFNPEKKVEVEGKFSLGAVLRCADTLWFCGTRATGSACGVRFLHCQPSTQKPRIVLRPSILGPVFFSAAARMVLMFGTQHLTNRFHSSLLAWLVDLLSFAPMCFAAHIIRARHRCGTKLQRSP